MADEGPNMLIVGIKDHFPARISEWFNAAILTSWGFYLILHPGLFDSQPIFASMKQMVWAPLDPEFVWGFIAASVGSCRLVALFINGAWSRTPILRLVTAAISAFVWTQVVLGLFTIPNTGLVVYPWLVVIDLVAAYRAGSDVATAALTRKHRLESGRARGNSSRNRAVA